MRSTKFVQTIPVIGTIVFVVLFAIAAFFYDGGTYLDPLEPRFSMIHNYWCDLLNATSHNGTNNSTRPYAITATIILCLSVIPFWIDAPNSFFQKNIYQLIVQVCGTLAMLIGMLIFTPLHSEAIAFAGLFGGIAFIGTLAGLFKLNWHKLFWFGIVCLLLGIISFTIYKTRIVIVALPLVQKITLLCCLFWILSINSEIKKLKRR